MTESTKNGKVISAKVETEVVAKAQRRKYTAEYKKLILTEVEGCKNAGEVGALLRREGLYSSLISKWRERNKKGAVAGLEPRNAGRKWIRRRWSWPVCSVRTNAYTSGCARRS